MATQSDSCACRFRGSTRSPGPNTQASVTINHGSQICTSTSEARKNRHQNLRGGRSSREFTGLRHARDIPRPTAGQRPHGRIQCVLPGSEAVLMRRSDLADLLTWRYNCGSARVAIPGGCAGACQALVPKVRPRGGAAADRQTMEEHHAAWGRMCPPVSVPYYKIYGYQGKTYNVLYPHNLLRSGNYDQ